MAWSFYNSSGVAKTGDQAIPPVPPMCSAYGSANISIANLTYTTVALNSETFDTNSMHDNATNNSRITCNTAGVYRITANIQFANHADGSRWLAINSSVAGRIALNYGPSNGGSTAALSLSVDHLFAVAEYVEMQVSHSAGPGNALDLLADSGAGIRLSATWVGKTA